MDDPRYSRRFPSSPGEWVSAPARIDMDEHGRTLQIFGFQVMQDWESPLMERMALSVTRPGASVLEIGYGLGISAKHVQALGPRTHVIIEANKEVAVCARRDLHDAILTGRAHVMEGTWEDTVSAGVLRRFAPHGFDGIIFDTYPLSQQELRRNHFAFFPHAQSLLSRRGRFTYFSDEEDRLSDTHRKTLEAVFPNAVITTEPVRVHPVPNCEYWTAESILHVVVELIET
jgi:guanidinoacetate N-methyltransferase